MEPDKIPRPNVSKNVFKKKILLSSTILELNSNQLILRLKLN